MNDKEFKEELSKLGIVLTSTQENQLEMYYNLLIEWNNKMNLTGITERNSVYLKHFYDCITLIKAIDLTKNLKIVDVGTGAGFPGLVLKIVFPNLDVVLVDALNKRINFLNHVIESLKLENIEAIHDRIENYAKNNLEVFDLVTCRAVAKLNIISELCLPLAKINGYFIPMKATIEDEISDTKYLEVLKSKVESVITFNLPIENSVRNLIVIKKYGSIDKKYPRQYDKIIKNPLK
ncbi:MAG: 16S rRNA (guanine(527)-N(7))-methyltransferase RsmG [Tenericutes bacterium]|nr:16S rRNA (guanine(527)-N(7))-methyltransferase RsmG [Mycoplasmatota bacterium]MDD7630063.1 16S rRNA (guanine(527)-N(7))-methyltransferase RsmG [bacterium]MDY4108848.1 16S rRNA (guanine(527)-N(7))-methyltransferase RsmG [Bacilli bacterium]